MRPRHLVALVSGFWTLGCISISGDPRGRFDIVAWTVTPAEGDAQTVADAGFLQLGELLECDSGAFTDDGTFDACHDDDSSASVSMVNYAWVGTGLVPLWAPPRTAFELPPWDGDSASWTGPIPLGDLSCTLRRDSRTPLVLTGTCTGADVPLDVELTMDH